MFFIAIVLVIRGVCFLIECLYRKESWMKMKKIERKIWLLCFGVFFSLIIHFILVYPMKGWESNLFSIAAAFIRSVIEIPLVATTLFCFYNLDDTPCTSSSKEKIIGMLFGFFISLSLTPSAVEMVLVVAKLTSSMSAFYAYVTGFSCLAVVLFVLFGGFFLGVFYVNRIGCFLFNMRERKKT